MKEFQLGEIYVILDESQIPVVFRAGVVILFSSDKLVMVWNQERGWEFPGGHREGRETWQETAIREVREEAQLEIRSLDYLGCYTAETGQVTLILSACRMFKFGEAWRKDYPNGSRNL